MIIIMIITVISRSDTALPTCSSRTPSSTTRAAEALLVDNRQRFSTIYVFPLCNCNASASVFNVKTENMPNCKTLPLMNPPLWTPEQSTILSLRILSLRIDRRCRSNRNCGPPTQLLRVGNNSNGSNDSNNGNTIVIIVILIPIIVVIPTRGLRVGLGLERAAEHLLRNPTKIHDDLWGVGFWRAIF